MLFSLHGLVKSITPTAAFHDTSSLLVHYLHLSVYHHVFIIFVEHGVGFEQLLQGVYPLALHSIVGHQLVFLVDALFVCKLRIGFQLRHLGGDIGQYEKVLVVHLLGQPVGTLVREFHRVEFLLYYEIKRLNGLGHFTVVVLHVIFLSLEHASLDAFLGKIFDKRFVLGKCLIGAEQGEEAFIRELGVILPLTFGDFLLGFSQQFGSLLALHLIESFHQRLVLLKHLVVTLWHWTGNNQRSTGIVNQHRVHLVYNGIVVLTLHEVCGTDGHVVSQVIKAELIVGSEGDVCQIGFATLV